MGALTGFYIGIIQYPFVVVWTNYIHSEIESTGSHTQFYDKFSELRPVKYIIEST